MSAHSSFHKKLEKGWINNKFICVGLDPDYDRIPKSIKGNHTKRIFTFNKAIVDATSDLVLAYKPNSAFYEAMGAPGIEALRKTISYVKKKHPNILVILDAKRGDIGSTNGGYVTYAFDYLNADAVTIHPYLGKEAMQPFLEKKDKGIFVLVRTSNPGSGEFQGLKAGGQPLFVKIAESVAKNWNENNNIGLVTGATYPKELAMIRKIAPEIPFLIPGIGKQGGDLKKTVKAGLDKNKRGIIISSSRDIIFADGGSMFANMARKKTQELNELVVRLINSK